jgi:ATP-dependent DNA helicase RecQ
MHLIDVLRGRTTERTAQWGHDKLNVFGLGADLDEAAWRNVFRQLAALGYIRPDHESYGALRLTDSSRPVLKGEQRVAMRNALPRKVKSTKTRRGTTSSALPAAAAGLLEQLKAWRLEQARVQSVPAFVIFHDRTLQEIATARPVDMDTLGGISGIGAKKLERYGAALLALMRG